MFKQVKSLKQPCSTYDILLFTRYSFRSVLFTRKRGGIARIPVCTRFKIKYATHICIRTIQSIYIILIFQISISWKWIWIRYFPNQYCKPARVFRAQRDSNVENASIRLRPNHQQSCSWLLEIPIHFIFPQTTQHTLCRLITMVLRYLIHWPLENSAVILKL